MKKKKSRWGKKKDRPLKERMEDMSVWDMMKKIPPELLAQQSRIKDKRSLLEENDVFLDTSHIVKREVISVNVEEPNEMSMWESVQLIQEKFLIEIEYHDKLEAAYDRAIKDLLGHEKVID
jgi:hypothetical protein